MVVPAHRVVMVTFRSRLGFHKFVQVTFLHLFSGDGSLYVSGKLHTYPSPKPTLALTSHLEQNVGLGEG